MKISEHMIRQDTLRITEKEKYGKAFLETIQTVVCAIEAAGYDPYHQLFGYLTSGNDKYITRNGNARDLVKQLNFSLLWDYTESVLGRKK